MSAQRLLWDVLMETIINNHSGNVSALPSVFYCQKEAEENAQAFNYNSE
jgi:hypothetical protein